MYFPEFICTLQTYPRHATSYHAWFLVMDQGQSNQHFARPNLRSIMLLLRKMKVWISLILTQLVSQTSLPRYRRMNKLDSLLLQEPALVIEFWQPNSAYGHRGWKRQKEKRFWFPDDLKWSLKPCSYKGASLNSANLELWGTITRKPHDVFLASFQTPTWSSFPGIMNSPGSVEQGELLTHLLLTHHEPRANPKHLAPCPNQTCPPLCGACTALLPFLLDQQKRRRQTVIWWLYIFF